MTRIVAVIPARMGSSRYPGKPLAKICGISMLEHVYRRTCMSKSLDEVHIATCDREISEAAAGFGAHCIMTSPAHERASDRVAEAAESIPADIYVMVQGDEPLIVPEMIDLALQPLLQDERVLCTNLAAPIENVKDFEDRNTIKVVMARNGDALFMSREAIPSRSRMPFGKIPAFKQVCVIPFRRDFLIKYTALEPTELEKAESIDMLRAMEHGYPIRLVPSAFPTQSVDTPEDLQRVEGIMRRDPRFQRYRGSNAS
jgi:3-deoxy-manno-octulosonate cytidylyltransferase (CMP-KDO synthetase)